MKLQYTCLDSALDLWPPGHFALEFFAPQIGHSEMECSDLGKMIISQLELRPRVIETSFLLLSFSFSFILISWILKVCNENESASGN